MSQHTVVIVRHAKASPDGPSGDASRELNDAGLAQAKALGAKLKDIISKADTVFVSGAARADQTWDAMAQGAGIDPSSVHIRTAPVIYSGASTAIWQAVRLESSGYTSVLIGHEPTVSEVANLLLKEDVTSPVAHGMPTGSAVVVEWGKNWKEWHSHCADLADFVHVDHK